MQVKISHALEVALAVVGIADAGSLLLCAGLDKVESARLKYTYPHSTVSQFMKKAMILCSVFLLAGLISPALAAETGDLDRVQGTWEVKKKNDAGEAYKQVLVIEKDKLTFKMVDSDDSVRLMAKGSIKLEKAGSISIMKIVNLEAGGSEGELSPIYDDRTVVYRVGFSTISVATNFDADRDDGGPALDTYRKVTK